MKKKNLICKILAEDTLEAILKELEVWKLHWGVTDELFDIARHRETQRMQCVPGIFKAELIRAADIWQGEFPIYIDELFEYLDTQFKELPLEVVASLGRQIPDTEDMRRGIQKIIGLTAPFSRSESIEIMAPVYWHDIHILTNPMRFSGLRRKYLKVMEKDLLLVAAS